MILAQVRAWFVFLPNLPTVLLALVQSSFQQQELLRTLHTEHLAALATLQTLVLSLAQEQRATAEEARTRVRDTQEQHTASLALLLDTRPFRQYLEEMDTELHHLQKTIRRLSTDVHATSAVLHAMDDTTRTMRLL
jgi:hypothetical protein